MLFSNSQRLLFESCIMVMCIGCGTDGDYVREKVSKPEVAGVICTAPEWDFGTLDPAKTPSIEHTFVLTNNGADAVQVGEIRSSCGCMAAKLASREIEPGKALEVKVTVTTAGQPGLFQKSLSVPFLSGDLPPINLLIKGNLVATVAIFSVPELVDFGEVEVGTLKRRQINLGRFDSSPLFVGDCKANLPGITVGVVEGSGGATVRVEIVADGDLLRAGSAKGYFDVCAKGSGASLLRVPLMVFGTRSTAGFRSSLFVPRLASGERVCLKITDDSGILRSVQTVAFETSDKPCDVTAELQSADSEQGNPEVYLVRMADAEGIQPSRMIAGKLRLLMKDNSDSVIIPLKVFLPKSLQK